MAATPSAARAASSRSSPRSAPASGPGSPATLVTEAHFTAGKRELAELLPLNAARPAVGARVEVDFTDYLYLGTVVRHGRGQIFDTMFDTDGETVTITTGKNRFRQVLPEKAAPKKKAAGPNATPKAGLGAAPPKKKQPAPNKGTPAPKRTKREPAPASKKPSVQLATKAVWVAPPAPATPASADGPAVIEWAQCDDISCGRWHALPPHISPSDLPPRFVCAKQWPTCPAVRPLLRVSTANRFFGLCRHRSP